MRIYPAIDLRKGRVVQLVGGDPGQVAVERPDAGAQAKAWREAEAGWVHVVDLDAAFGEANQWSVLQRILDRRLRVQFGGGIRSMVQVQKLLDLGVDRVVVGTQGILHPDWLRELCRVFPGRIVLAVDARGRDVVVKGWTERTGRDVVALACGLDDAGLAGFLYTNVEKEGRLQGVGRAVVEELRRNTPRTPLLVSGGIAALEDLEWLRAAGVDGVVLGMSIYTGAIDLREAIRRFDPPSARAEARPPPPAVPDAPQDDEAEAEAADSPAEEADLE